MRSLGRGRNMTDENCETRGVAGKNLSTERQSTIGEQRFTNYACRPAEEDFVALVTAGQPSAPGYFVYDAVLNRRRHAVLHTTPTRLDLDETLARQAAGAGVALRVIGERHRVDGELLALIDEARAKTHDNKALTLMIAFNYGARAEIAAAARRLAERVQRGEIDAGAISETTLALELETNGVPDPDLVIRTSGEQRLSNFLLWQAAYAELIFMDVKWPDFGGDQLQQAVSIFQSRNRRFGGIAQEAIGP